MKKTNQLHGDVANLLQQTVAEEATSDVWGRFETALEKLDAESLRLFQEYLNGSTPPQLALSRKLATAEVQEWIARIKRTIAHELRNDCNLRQ